MRLEKKMMRGYSLTEADCEEIRILTKIADLAKQIRSFEGTEGSEFDPTMNAITFARLVRNLDIALKELNTI